LVAALPRWGVWQSGHLEAIALHKPLQLLSLLRQEVLATCPKVGQLGCLVAYREIATWALGKVAGVGQWVFYRAALFPDSEGI
jgi:hypothetical protein